MAENKRYMTRIRLENFQNHKDTDIELEPGINLIVGSSDSGKSAVLRAINWVYHNKPNGTDFVHLGAEEARVTVWFNDGTMVCRIKGSKRNAIAIQKADGTQLAYEKIGNEIPPEALNALGKPPIDDKHGPISYADQMSPLFLTSLNTSDLPRSISELTGIDDFENAAQLLGKRSKRAGDDAKESQIRVDEYNKNLEQYVSLDEKLNTLQSFEDKAKIINNKIAQVNNIDGLLSKYELIRVTGKQTSLKLKRAKAISENEPKLLKIQKVKSDILSLDTLIKSHKDSIDKENNLKNVIVKLDRISTPELEDKIVKIKELLSKTKTISGLIKEYSNIIMQGGTIKANYKMWNDKHALLIKEKENMIAEMKNKGLWCDKCNRPLAIDNCGKDV